MLSISYFNVLLFHTLAEFFAITIAILTSIVAWNVYPFTRNNYLMFLGAGYFWIGILDLLHTLTWQGMQIIEITGPNVTIQFWLGARFFEAFLLLISPLFLTRTLQLKYVAPSLAVISISIILAVFTGLLPDVFIVSKGLTPFKIYSEYLIILILAAAIYHLYTQREYLEQRILRTLIISITLTMCAELAFTFYISMHGISMIVGHIFKIISFWLIFEAVTKTTLQEPFLAMSRSSITYDAIPDATIVIDQNGIIREANRSAYLLLNMKGQDLIGENNHVLFHKENSDIENCLICQAIINNKELRGLELEINDEGKWFNFSLSRIVGASSISGTVEVIRDITLRKKIEFDVLELTNLKMSIIENLPHILFVKDSNTNTYIEWNKIAEEITGISKNEIIGNTDYDIRTKEEAQFFIDADNIVIDSQSPLDTPEEIITTKNKGKRTLHTKRIPIFDRRGNLKYLLGISEDITDKLKTDAMLRRSQKMDAIGKMSGGIAHDFNNQLSIILGYTDLLENKALTDSSGNWIDYIRKAADRCAELTQQLLIFSRNEEVRTKIVNVNDILSDMKVIIQRTMTPSINISYVRDDALWDIEVNEGGCKDLILNVVLNASDAMPNGGSLTIKTNNFILDEQNTLSLPQLLKGDYIEIMIKDTGCGMTQEVYSHAFEPFYTTKDVGEGTGLGLSMVYAFVRRYNGDILLETSLGQGATFKIYLPRTIQNKSIAEQYSSKSLIIPKGDKRILLVEDEMPILLYAQNILKSWGYDVSCANNPAEALIYLQNESFDLLFSDVVMPGNINGYDLAIEAINLQSKLKILITSGFTNNISNNEQYQSYNFDLLPKPYKRDDLAKAIYRILCST